jgi:cation-transporting P-type ATPase F
VNSAVDTVDEDRAHHQLAVHETVLMLDTDPEVGLSSREASERLRRLGPNQLPQLPRPGALRRFGLQLHNPLIYVLLAASAVTFALGEHVDGGVILGVVVAIAVIGFVQESRAEDALESLRRMVRRTSTVVRDGEASSISSEELVPGDLILIRSGEMVSADGRLIASRQLEIDESALTGESLPVGKSVAELPAATGIGDRANIAYSGTLVTRGEGKAIVVATGAQTEIGLIHRLIGEAAEVQTPLTRKIARFGKALTVAILLLTALTYLVGLLRGGDPAELFVAAVALAVGAIPEGLPATITVTLAVGVRYMATRNAIVRRLPAVETLGSTTVICSDKTGTLTQNRMTVEAIWAGGRRHTVSGTGYGPDAEADLSGPASGEAAKALRATLEAGVLCNDSRLGEDGAVIGDPTEAALLASARDLGVDPERIREREPRLDSIPFESERRYMATLHRGPDGDRICAKGAVETILEMCSQELESDGGRGPLDPVRIRREAAMLAERGLRVLALAEAETAAAGRLDPADPPRGLAFLGLQAMLDPPRPEAIAAVEACWKAGIRVKMITGDHAGTARAIAKQLGLAAPGPDAPPVLTGAELAELEGDELRAAAARTPVFARVSAEQKLRLVEALQRSGEVVAMTGDGINDAPALKRADIGVAMGRSGTEVAREASDIVLTDDNFASIEAAVEEGRRVFDNLTKFIVFILPTNLGQGLLIVTAIAAGVALPILPVQILWINLTTAVALGMPLAFERAEPGVMDRSPRNPGAPILDRELIGRMILVAGLLLVGSFGLFEWARARGASLEEARTVAVNVFLLGESFYLLNCRSLSGPMRRIGAFSNAWVLVGIATIVALQILYTYAPPMNTLFHSAPIDAQDWLAVSGVGAAIWATVGFEKWLRARRRGDRGPASR